MEDLSLDRNAKGLKGGADLMTYMKENGETPEELIAKEKMSSNTDETWCSAKAAFGEVKDAEWYNEHNARKNNLRLKTKKALLHRKITLYMRDRDKQRAHYLEQYREGPKDRSMDEGQLYTNRCMKNHDLMKQAQLDAKKRVEAMEGLTPEEVKAKTGDLAAALYGKALYEINKGAMDLLAGDEAM